MKPETEAIERQSTFDNMFRVSTSEKAIAIYGNFLMYASELLARVDFSSRVPYFLHCRKIWCTAVFDNVAPPRDLGVNGVRGHVTLSTSLCLASSTGLPLIS